MKKYIAPKSQVIKIELEGLLCLSLQDQNADKNGPVLKPGSRTNDWDDFEK